MLGAVHVVRERIEVLLVRRAHQHARVVLEDVLAPVAVVDVEVDEGDALQAVEVGGVPDPDGDVVEEAESHRGGALGVVARRTHAAERRRRLAGEHQVGRQHDGARRAQGGDGGERVHVRVRVHVDVAFQRRRAERLLHMLGRVGPRELRLRRQRRLVHAHVVEQAAKEQPVMDGGQPRRRLRMARAHLVSQAVVVGDVGAQHRCLRGSARDRQSFRPSTRGSPHDRRAGHRRA